jgi:hypothetical protein
MVKLVDRECKLVASAATNANSKIVVLMEAMQLSSDRAHLLIYMLEKMWLGHLQSFTLVHTKLDKVWESAREEHKKTRGGNLLFSNE